VLLRVAGIVLMAERPAILDAVFLKPEERAAAEAGAETAGVAFQGVWLQAPPEVMAERISARSGDASDADVRVLEQQLKRDPGPVTWKVVQG
jgi:predicted kinase